VLIAIVKSRAHPAQNSLFFLQHQAVDLDCHGTILNASMVTEYRNRGVERTSRGSSGQLRCARSPGPSVPGAKAGLAWGFVSLSGIFLAASLGCRGGICWCPCVFNVGFSPSAVFSTSGAAVVPCVFKVGFARCMLCVSWDSVKNSWCGVEKSSIKRMLQPPAISATGLFSRDL
jgi:hypothetical protein